MKKQINHGTGLSEGMNRSLNFWSGGILSLLITIGGLLPLAAQAQTGHDVSAANLNVEQLTSGTDSNSISVTAVNTVNDFRVRPESNQGDYNVQIGDDPLDDQANGVLMSSVTENGRSNVFCVSFTAANANGYFIPVHSVSNTAPEGNINVAGAWFPYTTWLGGSANNSANNGPYTSFAGSAGLTLGIHFSDLGGGRSMVDLTSLGIDSRTDGILLATGSKNETANYGLAQVNTDNGTWNLFLKDAAAVTPDGFESDPIAFVFVPKTNTSVISGRFLGDGSIDMFSGTSPQFTVTTLGEGRYELTIPGHSPANGVLILSPEGGGVTNQDNMVSYQATGTNASWEIQTRDTPGSTIAPPPLESPSAGEGVVSFVYIPTPDIIVTPTSGLVTTEAGGTDTFDVSLHTQPTGDVTIPVASSDLTEGSVSTSSLVFTPANWSTPQTVTITGQDDAIADSRVNYTIILSPATSTDPIYNGLDATDVSVGNDDNEASVVVAPNSGLITTEAGGTATFIVRLNSQPSSDVTIALSSSDTTEGTVSPSSVTFNTGNWNIDQTVTVTGVNDLVDDGDIAYTIFTGATVGSGSYNGLNVDDVSVTNADDDTSAVTISANALSVVEGKTNSYTLVLESEPVANVVITVASNGDTAQGGTFSPGTLTFTPGNWSVAQSVTITGADDLALDGHTAWSITNSVGSADPTYAALSPVSISVTTLDNEPSLVLPSGDMIYGIGLTNVGIDGRATLSDTNTPNYNGATIVVTLTANGTSDDRVQIRNTGTSAGQISVSGNTVSFEGVAIGTFSGGTGTTPLSITLNSSATPAGTQVLLQNVTFHNVNNSPSLNRRSVSFVVTKADNGVASAATGIRVGLLRATSFQEGADHGYGVYSGEADITIQLNASTTSFPTGNANGLLFIDFPSPGGNSQHTLMRFDNIFGEGLGQVPTNATIVSADLLFTLGDTGHGSPLYRMLRTWDATNETWASMGSGVDQDDVESRSTFDSQFGTVSGSGLSGVGNVSVSVMPDILVWQSGVEENFGWALPGWVGNNNGTGIRPGEAPNISERPRLRILWVPEGTTTTASFRQGVDGYASAFDTRIRQNAPDTASSTVATVFVDAEVTAGFSNPEQVLIRFDDIFGFGAGQIRPNSEIHAAVLDVASVVANAPGEGGTFHSMLQPWQHTDTWNILVNGISNDDVEAIASPSAVAGSATLGDMQGGYHTFEFTSDVQAWASGARPNYGWAVLPFSGGANGWAFGTAETATEINRPRLRVYYTPGPAQILIQSVSYTPTAVTINFSGEIGTTYSVRRAATVDGTYGIIGSAEVQPNGTATFIDSAPLANGAFYQISNP